MHGVVVVRFLRGFCDRWWSARGVERTRAESVWRWGVSSSRVLQASEDFAWSRRVRSRRGVDDVVAAKTGTTTVSSCRGVHLVVAMAGTTEHSFGAWLHPGPKLFALVLCVHSYSQDRCDKTFVLLMRPPGCNHGRCDYHVAPCLAAPTLLWKRPSPGWYTTHTHCCGQDRCDKTFVLLMRAPRCNHGRRY